MGFSQGIPCPSWGDASGGSSAGADVVGAFLAGVLGSSGHGPVDMDRANAPKQQASLKSSNNITSSLNEESATDQGGNDPGGKKNQKANQGGESHTTDRGLAVFGLGAAATENLSGITRIGSNLALYAASRNGGVFMGNQFVKTFSVAKIGKIAGIGGAVIGTGLDLYGVYKGTTTWGQAEENGVFTAIGLSGGPVGAVISVGYFGLNAFYPGVANQAASDFSNSWSQHAQSWGQIKMEQGGL